MSAITPCLWFDTQALDAANYYVSVFPNSEIKNISYYTEGTPGKPGSVMVVDFLLDDNKFMTLNAGPTFTHSPAISFIIPCKNQEEVDHYWDALSAVPEAEQCGWVRDKFGVSWQIIPNILRELMIKDASGKVMKAMMNMKKINIAELEKAYNS